MNVFLWGVLPYVMMAILVGGLIWRYRYDQFGWTTRSSQLYESRLLRIGSPLFHFGILVVIIGHIGGLVFPKSWTESPRPCITSTRCCGESWLGSARWSGS
jgi:nitrate reductase gamma subunit